MSVVFDSLEKAKAAAQDKPEASVYSIIYGGKEVWVLATSKPNATQQWAEGLPDFSILKSMASIAEQEKYKKAELVKKLMGVGKEKIESLLDQLTPSA